MSEKPNTRLRIVKLINPSDCISCRFAHIAIVEMVNGSNRRMLNCKRLDCDNWNTEHEDEETPKNIYEERG